MPESGDGGSPGSSARPADAGADQASGLQDVNDRAILGVMHEGFHIIELIYDGSGTAVEYRYLDTNPMFEQQTGRPSPVGHLGSEVTPGTERHWFCAYDHVVRTGESVHFEGYNAFTDRWYDTQASRVGGQGAHKVAVAFADITERNRLDAAPRCSTPWTLACACSSASHAVRTACATTATSP